MRGLCCRHYASLGGQDASKATLASLGGSLLQAPPVTAAAAHIATPAQVLLRWALQKGFAIVPKANGESRLVENTNLFHFVLSAAEMAALDALERGSARLSLV